MKRRFMTLLVGMWIAASAGAEFFLDIYGGKVYAAGGTFAGIYSERTSSIYGSDTFRSWSALNDLGGAKGTSYGIRGGYWFESGLGIALDVSRFGVDPGDSVTEIDLSPASLLLMYRYPLLVTDQFSRGRMHPYVGAGFSYGSVEVKTHCSHLYNDYDLSEDSTCFGFDFRLGLKWFFTRHLAVFGEYRFSALSFEQNAHFQSGDSWILPSVTRNHSINTEGDVPTHHLQGGVSYHF